MNLSIRYKLLIVLTLLPVAALALYLLLATQFFEKDKIAYAYDTVRPMSFQLAAQVQAEINSITEKVLPIVENYDPTLSAFKKEAQLFFNQQTKVKYISFFKKAGNLKFIKTIDISKSESMNRYASQNFKTILPLINKAVDLGVAINIIPGTSYILMAISNESGQKSEVSTIEPSSEKPKSQEELDAIEKRQGTVVFFIAMSDKVQQFFSTSLNPQFKSYLVNGSGQIHARPEDEDAFIKNSDNIEYFATEKWSDQPVGIQEFTKPDGQKVIASFAKVGIGDLKAISYVEKAVLLSTTKLLYSKSVLFFIAIISSTIIISLLASKGLTSTISELFSATRQVANGKFDIEVKVRSKDEVGGLAKSFNQMAKEVLRLMRETAEKARMANELETAKMVQETLFPPAQAVMSSVRVSGFYQPASECGGDWWHYCEIGNYIFLWIGDATGHGAPAALITSAAKSAASIIEQLPDMKPSTALSYINTAIHGTSQGNMMMTFFLAAINKLTGEMSYSNASHDPPFLLRSKRPLKRKDLVVLDAVNGPRLGHNTGSIYEETTVQLEKGDRVLFYTDGLTELKARDGGVWGERRYLKAVLEATEDGDLDQFISSIRHKFEEYRNNAPLEDDVTYFAVEFNNTPNAA